MTSLLPCTLLTRFWPQRPSPMMAAFSMVFCLEMRDVVGRDVELRDFVLRDVEMRGNNALPSSRLASTCPAPPCHDVSRLALIERDACVPDDFRPDFALVHDERGQRLGRAAFGLDAVVH